MRRGIGGHQSAKSRTDEWLTPPEIIKSLGAFDLDPCSPIKRPWDTAVIHYTIYDNGLLQEWSGRVWLNPPYGREVGRWLNKLSGHGDGIAMVFARTETAFFFDNVWNQADSILFMQGRPHFYTVEGRRAGGCGGPVALISYGKNNVEALEYSKIPGKHVHLNYTPIIVVGVSPTWFSIVSIAARQFGDEELKPVYDMVEMMAPDKIVNNQHWKAKVRQQIQLFRKSKGNNLCQS